VSGVLLDTCALIWVAEGATMDPAAVNLILEAALGHGVFVSPVSAWEVGLLASKGRLTQLTTAEAAARWFGRFMARSGVHPAQLTQAIALDAAFLPDLDHRDPADRFLIATARQMALPIVTRDRKILAYAAAGHVPCIPC
jgi:PIN domain nuclease of toxin-antitoxin system